MAAEPMPDLSSQYLHGEVDMTLQNSRVWPWACPYYSCVHIAVILHVCRKKKRCSPDTKWSGGGIACLKHCQQRKKVSEQNNG